jgi:putative ABC transport system ATP-binding protein
VPVDRPAGALVQLNGVGFTYPGPPPATALRPSDLVIRRGEYVALVGPSGSGKSTLLNVIGLLDRPTEGSYHLAGVDVGALPDHRRTALRAHRIGFVFQAFHLLPHRTAEENVALALLYRGTAATVRRAVARQVLQRVGLQHLMTALPTQMSGGERQRVAIARALAADPALLLCDEPTGNLDTSTAATVLSLIDELHHGGQTIVMITHDMNVARRAERAVTIRDGIIADLRTGVDG